MLNNMKDQLISIWADLYDMIYEIGQYEKLSLDINKQRLWNIKRKLYLTLCAASTTHPNKLDEFFTVDYKRI